MTEFRTLQTLGNAELLAAEGQKQIAAALALWFTTKILPRLQFSPSALVADRKKA